MEAIATISRFRLGKPERHQNLWIVPVFSEGEGTHPYLSLKEALQRELAEITEVSEGGSVPELRVQNKSALPIVLIDGEELAGAKQNRIVNTTILLAPQSVTVIPVSCTEAGRWRYRSAHFSESGNIMSSKARYAKSSRVKDSLEKYQRYDAGQSEVWGSVDKLHAKMKTMSHTSAMSDVYEQRKEDLAAFVEAFPVKEGQKGMVALYNKKLAGFDYLSRTEAYKDIHEKLLRSHSIEALAEPVEEAEEQAILDEVARFLQELEAAPVTSANPPVGLGTDIRFEDAANSGFKLVYEEEVIHEYGFRKAVALEE